MKNWKINNVQRGVLFPLGGEGVELQAKIIGWVIFYIESSANTGFMQITKILSPTCNWGRKFNL